MLTLLQNIFNNGAFPRPHGSNVQHQDYIYLSVFFDKKTPFLLIERGIKRECSS